MVGRQAEREIELLTELLDHVETASEEKVAGWETAALTSEERREYVQDEREFHREILIQVGQLAIAGLNQVVELNTKRLLRKLQPPPEVSKLHQLDYLKKYLQSHKIRLKSLAEYPAVSEIREISNATKHVGSVTKKLDFFPGWVHGEPLGDVRSAFPRLAPKVPLFLEALEAEVERPDTS